MLIPADSELYKKIMPLKSGDVVVFSGKLVSGDYSKKIVDLTTSYGYKNKKLYIDFTDIEKCLLKSKFEKQEKLIDFLLQLMYNISVY